MNGRILESDVLSHGLESGYRTDLMQHQFPFAVLYLTIPQNLVDVNIHPAKREVRFSDSQKVYEFIDRSVFRTLHKEELIPRATLQTGKEIREEEQKEKEALAGEHIEPFEIKKTGGRLLNTPENQKPPPCRKMQKRIPSSPIIARSGMQRKKPKRTRMI